MAVAVTACGAQAERAPAPGPSGSLRVDPARIDRVRSEVPPGYEVADLAGPVDPVALWGYGTRWSAEPAACAALVEPTAAETDGWSASGPGGIVYAVIAAAPTPAEAAPADACGRWTLSGGRTTGTVTSAPGPPIDGTRTVAMATASTTVVEGGTETRSHADTVTAYLGDHVAIVIVVTDPGAPSPQLPPAFAATLLVKTVSMVRG